MKPKSLAKALLVFLGIVPGCKDVNVCYYMGPVADLTVNGEVKAASEEELASLRVRLISQSETNETDVYAGGLFYIGSYSALPGEVRLDLVGPSGVIQSTNFAIEEIPAVVEVDFDLTKGKN